MRINTSGEAASSGERQILSVVLGSILLADLIIFIFHPRLAIELGGVAILASAGALAACYISALRISAGSQWRLGLMLAALFFAALVPIYCGWVAVDIGWIAGTFGLSLTGFGAILLERRRDRSIYMAAAVTLLLCVATPLFLDRQALLDSPHAVLMALGVCGITTIAVLCSEREYSLRERSRRLRLRNTNSVHELDEQRRGLSFALLTITQFENLGRGVIQGIDERASNLRGMNQSLEEFAQANRQMGQQIDGAIHEQSKDLQHMQSMSQELIGGQDRLTEAVRSLQEFVRGTAEDLSDLTQHAKRNIVLSSRIGDSFVRLGEIKNFVQEIADKTNLLAINASIEAARLGKSGDGFAVVANEIDKLAKFNKEQGEAITSIIEESEELISEVDRASRATDLSAQHQTNAVAELSRTITDLVSISENHGMLGVRMAAGIDQMQASGRSITELSEKHHARNDRIAAMASEVSGLSDGLTEATGMLNSEFLTLEAHATTLADLSQKDDQPGEEAHSP